MKKLKVTTDMPPEECQRFALAVFTEALEELMARDPEVILRILRKHQEASAEKAARLLYGEEN